jgi:hypothetical protein
MDVLLAIATPILSYIKYEALQAQLLGRNESRRRLTRSTERCDTVVKLKKMQPPSGPGG